MTVKMDPESHEYPFEEVPCPFVTELGNYWFSLCPEGGLPLVGQFDLIEFPQHAPWIAIVDVLDQGKDFRLRMVGTKVTRVFGGDITGSALSEGGRQFVEERIGKIYRYVHYTGGPIWGGGRVGNIDGRAGFESAACLLPLVDEKGEMAQIIHMIRLETPDGNWMV